MQKALTLFETSIGKKAVMALTGLVMYGFVIGHLIGNLQVFMGPEQLNGYAVKLRELGPLLWVVRGTLLLCLVLHIQIGRGFVEDQDPGARGLCATRSGT